jgi:hypothetical protein
MLLSQPTVVPTHIAVIRFKPHIPSPLFSNNARIDDVTRGLGMRCLGIHLPAVIIACTAYCTPYMHEDACAVVPEVRSRRLVLLILVNWWRQWRPVSLTEQ